MIVGGYTRKRNIKLDGNHSNERTNALEIIFQFSKGSSTFYYVMIDKIEVLDIKSFMKWEKHLNIPIDWHDALKRIKKIKEIKLKWFQLRICHRILVTNKIYKMKVTDNERCNFCNKEKRHN